MRKIRKSLMLLFLVVAAAAVGCSSQPKSHQNPRDATPPPEAAAPGPQVPFEERKCPQHVASCNAADPPLAGVKVGEGGRIKNPCLRCFQSCEIKGTWPDVMTFEAFGVDKDCPSPNPFADPKCRGPAFVVKQSCDYRVPAP